MRIRYLAGAVAALALAVAPSAEAKSKSNGKGKPVPIELQLLAINDFHGALEPPAGSSGRIGSVTAGGAEYLATHLAQAERSAEHSLILSAGDLVGASPLLSALFHDEPSIEAMNAIGLDLNAVGNHEFDEGVAELKRLAEGGCHPTDGCQDGTPFSGADFGFLAANVVWKDSGEPIFDPYAVRTFDGVKVGFIGMTLENTPSIVDQAGIKDVDFLDEAQTVNRYVKELRRQGVRAIVVLLHEGGVQRGGINECNGISGPIVDIVERTTDKVDLWITGHTHQAYSCVIDGDPVTSASSNGRLYTDIDLLLHPRNRKVVGVQKNNVIVTRDVERSSAISDLIGHYKPFADELASRVVGELTAPAPNTGGSDPDTNVAGKLIADSQLAATQPASAVAAFMNPGGVRGAFDAGTLTYGEIFAVQPFGNSLITITLTGAQVLDVLKQQWCGQTGSSPRILLPSATVNYTYSTSVAQSIFAKPCDGAPNPVSNVTIAGASLDPTASYRVTVNSFLAGGGDNFPTLAQGIDPAGGPLDLDAVEAYLAANRPLSPPTDDRVVVVD